VRASTPVTPRGCRAQIVTVHLDSACRVKWRLRAQIIAVHVDDPEYKHMMDVKELPKHRLLEIRRFFEDYKKNENKEARAPTAAAVISSTRL
jgi:Inorganic pyrophosphatase